MNNKIFIYCLTEPGTGTQYENVNKLLGKIRNRKLLCTRLSIVERVNKALLEAMK